MPSSGFESLALRHLYSIQRPCGAFVRFTHHLPATFFVMDLLLEDLAASGL